MTKIPRALRFNDRVSMRSSTELREPFLDHRLVELAMRQPANRKIRDGVRKWLPRHIAKAVAPQGVVEAPKRPLQTPQREWLQGPLREWALTLIEEAVAKQPWFRDSEVKTNLNECEQQGISNSFFIWQWVSIRLLQTI